MVIRRPSFALVVVALVACGGGGSNGSSGMDGGAGSEAGPGAEASVGTDGGGGTEGGAIHEGGAVDAAGPDSGGTSVAGLRAFFTDLVSGPSTGGQNGKGAFVTVYGKGFGAARGSSTVTVGGGAADNYPVWSDTRITIQLGAAAQTGNVVVVVPSKGASNGLPFTVRAGNVYFVSSTGKDSNDGSFGSPWATIPMAKNTIQAGDVAYVGTSAGDSVSQTTVDASSSYDGALGMSFDDGTNSGTAAAPKALVVYPGATATIGDPSNLERGIIVPAISGTFDYWVIAGFNLRGVNEAINLEGESDGWRIVGNDISCPNGSTPDGCVTGGVASPTNLAFYGNVVHDVAANVTTVTKYYHAVYFGSSHLDLGWNTVENGKTCRAIQFHDTGGPNEFDLHVHDNLIHGTVCDGINFATVDPSQGPVEAYNNVIYDVGQGPDPADGASDYAGVYVAGETDSGNAGGGVVQVYDNTLYGCGSWTQSSDAGGFNNGGGNPSLSMNLVNNIVAADSAMEPYLAKDATLVTGNNNLFYGAGAAPAGLTASVTGNPTFVNAAGFDFHLLAGSAAIAKGVSTTAVTDFDGNTRPASGPFDIGAFQYVP